MDQGEENRGDGGGKEEGEGEDEGQKEGLTSSSRESP